MCFVHRNLMTIFIATSKTLKVTRFCIQIDRFFSPQLTVIIIRLFYAICWLLIRCSPVEIFDYNWSLLALGHYGFDHDYSYTDQLSCHSRIYTSCAKWLKSTISPFFQMKWTVCIIEWLLTVSRKFTAEMFKKAFQCWCHQLGGKHFTAFFSIVFDQ